jgi:serine/threonine protein kinase
LGCIFYELHTTFSPFKDDGAIREWALTKPFEAVKIPFPHDAIYIMRSLEAEHALLNKMLDREGEERPSARDVEKEMNDDWVTCLFRGRGSPQTNFRKMPMFIRS